MPEQMNVEVAHNLSEREKAAGAKRRWEEVIEIEEVVVLALAAIATAWSGYQAAKGDGQQSVLYSNASVDRLRASTAAEQFNEKAAVAEEAGTEARHTAEEYVRATVLFALVLFLIALGQRFRLRGVRVATIVLAVTLFGYGLYDIATLPRL